MMSEPPKEIWLQYYGDCSPGCIHGEIDVRDSDITWCADKINDNDIRYIIDERYLRAKNRRKVREP